MSTSVPVAREAQGKVQGPSRTFRSLPPRSAQSLAPAPAVGWKHLAQAQQLGMQGRCRPPHWGWALLPIALVPMRHLLSGRRPALALVLLGVRPEHGFPGTCPGKAWSRATGPWGLTLDLRLVLHQMPLRGADQDLTHVGQAGGGGGRLLSSCVTWERVGPLSVLRGRPLPSARCLFSLRESSHLGVGVIPGPRAPPRPPRQAGGGRGGEEAAALLWLRRRGSSPCGCHGAQSRSHFSPRAG